jgi:hypothetical protein
MQEFEVRRLVTHDSVLGRAAEALGYEALSLGNPLSSLSSGGQTRSPAAPASGRRREFRS